MDTDEFARPVVAKFLSPSLHWLSFIFTADHHMSKIGNHGDGDNTRTPLNGWEIGMKNLLPDIIPSHAQCSRSYQRLSATRSGSYNYFNCYCDGDSWPRHGANV
ncbi:hypothetical protein EV424DRAFT_1447109 [Suillus variegatus]|nr:hypothetical protein EV424DRAFT_1447109 [Suillus variegatus]